MRSDGYSARAVPDTPNAQATPERLAYALCDSGETVTYGQLESRSNQAAHLFRACGVHPGDHIAIVMENARQFFEVCFAADRSGLYSTPVSTHLTAAKIGFILRDCGAKVVVASAKVLKKTGPGR